MKYLLALIALATLSPAARADLHCYPDGCMVIGIGYDDTTAEADGVEMARQHCGRKAVHFQTKWNCETSESCQDPTQPDGCGAWLPRSECSANFVCR